MENISARVFLVIHDTQMKKISGARVFSVKLEGTRSQVEAPENVTKRKACEFSTCSVGARLISKERKQDRIAEQENIWVAGFPKPQHGQEDCGTVY